MILPSKNAKALRRERRAREKAERKAATKARLAASATPPTVPVALPWQRRVARVGLRREVAVQGAVPQGAVWSSPLMSGDVGDAAGAALAAVSLVTMLGPVLKGRR